MTIRSFLFAHFGNASRIDGIDAWGDVEIQGAYFCVGEHSELSGHAGGVMLIGFQPAKHRRALYLVYDDTEGRIWDSKHLNQGGKRPRRPNPRLCLVQSA